MKTAVFSVLAVSLLQLAAAQPHRHAHKHRDVVVVTDVVVNVVASKAVDEYVYVNQQGQTLSTVTSQPTDAPAATAQQTTVAAQPQKAAVKAASDKPAQAAPVLYNKLASGDKAPAQAAQPDQAYSKPASAKAQGAAPAPAPAANQPAAKEPAVSAAPKAVAKKPVPAPKPAPKSAAVNAGSNGLGIVYSPYNTDHSCKSQAQVSADFQKITGYGFVRIYGVDCNQVVTVGTAAKAKGMKLFAGIYDINQVNKEIGMMIQAVRGDWSHIETIGIGNEVVQSGKGTPGQVVSAIGSARNLLNAAGYKGKIVAVDTFDAVIANPELCLASDFAAVNAHAFFDSTVTASQAGEWAEGTAKRVSAKCPGKETVITESGWPSKGSPNGKATPSTADQQAAIKSLKSVFSSNLIVFSAYNDLWKTNNAGTFGAEQYWGILGDSS